MRSAKQLLSQKVLIYQNQKFGLKYLNLQSIDDQLEINAHYKGYLTKQKVDILAQKGRELNNT